MNNTDNTETKNETTTVSAQNETGTPAKSTVTVSLASFIAIIVLSAICGAMFCAGGYYCGASRGSKSGNVAVETQNATGSSEASLGVTVKDVPSNSFGVVSGAYVESIFAGANVQTAGLRSGDVIIGFDGQNIEDARDLVAAVTAKKAGDTVQISFLREESAHDVDAEMVLHTIRVTLNSKDLILQNN